MTTAAASGLYFLAVFGAGFILGPIRLLLVEPRLGAFAAVLCEAPFLLAVIVVASRWAPRTLSLEPTRRSMVLVGLGALVMQQIADLIVGSTLRGLSPEEQFARFATPEGGVYAVMLILFAAMPALANKPSASIRPRNAPTQTAP